MANQNRFYVDVSSLHKEVTGSCILNTIKFPNERTTKVLVDCGLFQEREYSELNKSLPFIAENIDHVIVTHNHVDHIGRLPLLVKQGFHGKIHMSYDTSILIKNALMDSYKVLRKKAEAANEPLLYSDDDVDKTLSLICPSNYEESIWLDDNIKVTFFMNGHLPGAIVALMQIRYSDFERKYENINLLYTGDYNNNNMFFDVSPIPKWVHQLPINIIQESTYGSMDSTEIEHVFEGNIVKAVKEEKEIVIPVFSLGRSQEIMLILKQMQESGKLSKDIPIYFDGKLGIRYTKLYLQKSLFIKEDVKDFLPENFSFVEEKSQRESILMDNKPKILLTTSGMGSYGPAQVYLPAFLKKEKALIHFTGYLAEDTLGRKLIEAASNSVVEMSGLSLKKKAEVKTTCEFSAHAKADELINFLRPFEDIKMVLINHGSNENKDIYSQRVVNEIDPKSVGILGRDYLYRLNAFGLAKPPISTKF